MGGFNLVKDLDAIYGSGKRGAGWFKIKAEWDCDVIITGYQDGKDGWTGLVGAVLFSQPDAHGNMVQRGKCSGFDMEMRQEFTANGKKYLNTVMTIKHYGVMPTGGWRHPNFLRLRDDKSASEDNLA